MYTVRDLIRDLSAFEMDAVIKPMTEGDIDLFYITNPIELAGHTEWVMTTEDV